MAEVEQSQLGFVINDVDLNNLSSEQFERIQQALWTHDIAQQVQFTEKWGNLIILPPYYAFENRDPEHPSIVRVGNVRLDDSVKPNSKDAEYWHKDGNFRQAGENFIISILVPKEIASVGGQTGYACSEQVIRDLPVEIKNKLEDAQIIVKTQNISDFKDAKPEEHLPHAPHSVFPTHPITGRKIFNVTQKNPQDLILKDGTIINSLDLNPEIEKAYKIHAHQWEMGDVVIWDNIRTIHRSLGGFGNSRRLLFRTQAQIPY